MQISGVTLASAQAFPLRNPGAGAHQSTRPTPPGFATQQPRSATHQLRPADQPFSRATHRGRLFFRLATSVLGLIAAGAPYLPSLSSTTSAATPSASIEPIRIGFFAPLSGDNAEYGRHFLQAITLYTEKVNAAGGLHGHPLQIDAQDDRANPREAANIAQRFASDRSILATIGSFSSTASLAAAPILERAGVVQLSPSSSHPDFTRLGTYLFRNVNMQTIEGPLDARFAIDELKARRIAVLFRQDDWGLTASDAFTKAVEAQGAKVVFSEAVVQGTRDFRPLLTKLRAQSPDLIYVALFYADAAVFAQQLRQAGINLPVVTNSSLNNPQLIELAGAAVEGWYVPTNYFPGDPSPVVQNFLREYRQRWNEEPDQFAAIAYDSIGVIAHAIDTILASGKPLTRQAIRDELYALPPYRGVSGLIKFNAEGDVEKPMTWLVIRNGKFQLFGKAS
ncbi:MAG: ABC transporter substrate-binding protein [Limnochordaceae bacterium]|nr:ABC transporter substrate-binding protein [Limnochordaceae bacterium]